MTVNSIDEAKEKVKGIPVPEGHRRGFLRCRTCKAVAVSDYIPFSLGQGQRYLSCACHLTGNDKRLGYDVLETVDAST